MKVTSASTIDDLQNPRSICQIHVEFVHFEKKNPPSAYLLPLWGRCHPQRRWGGRSTGGAGIGRKGLSESTSLDPRPATFHRRPPSAAELRAVIPGSRNMGGVIPRSRRLQCRRSRPSYVDYGPTFAIWPFHQLENPCFERDAAKKRGETHRYSSLLVGEVPPAAAVGASVRVPAARDRKSQSRSHTPRAAGSHKILCC